MAELTGLFGVDWAVVSAMLFGIAIVAMSLRRDVRGRRIGPFLIVPLVAGVLLVTALSIHLKSAFARFDPFLLRPITLTLVIAAALVVAAVADVLFSRLVPVPRQLWPGESPGWLADVSLVVFVGGAALATNAGVDRLASITYIEPSPSGLAAGLAIEATYALPSAPLDAVLRGERDGYLSLGSRVVHFVLPNDGSGDLSLTTVADDFTYSRGLTIADHGRVLVVADLGPLPCPDPYPECKSLPGMNDIEAERTILDGSQGRLLAFDIQPDGSLTNERVILDDLPVVNTEHGVNDVATGPDGRIYVSIGNLDHTPANLAGRLHHPNKDFMGTVLRLSPNGDGVEVYAHGLRNVYGLAFDPGGGLWGVDNDGETANGWRAEEVLHIRRGHEYGYPYEGSFGRLTLRNDFAVWDATGPGSAGILWAGEVGLGPGLLISSLGHIDGLRLTKIEGQWAVQDDSSYAELLQLPGFVSHLEPLGSDRILATSVIPDALYVLSVSG